jgi:hypothetical protein
MRGVAIIYTKPNETVSKIDKVMPWPTYASDVFLKRDMGVLQSEVSDPNSTLEHIYSTVYLNDFSNYVHMTWIDIWHVQNTYIHTYRSWHKPNTSKVLTSKQSPFSSSIRCSDFSHVYTNAYFSGKFGHIFVKRVIVYLLIKLGTEVAHIFGNFFPR